MEHTLGDYQILIPLPVVANLYLYTMVCNYNGNPQLNNGTSMMLLLPHYIITVCTI